jgi:hypothetical protein
MFQPNGSTIECDTCVASNTSACGECIVSFVLANDAGPIEYVPTPVDIRPSTDAAGSIDAAVELFVRAGLVDDPVVLLSSAEFEEGVVRERVAG